MYFFIDFENVKCNGMKGIEYLLPSDSIEIFFSDACRNIYSGIFEELKESGCTLKICKLKTVRKNGLDFYIATRLGAVFGNGFNGNTIIVSNDKGFKAVQEYWRECADDNHNIFIAPNIIEGIISANENNERTKRAREFLKFVSIETEYAKYEEQRRIRNLLVEQFAKTEYEDRISEIESIYKKDSGNKILYLDSLKTFGKREGLEIYSKIKQIKER